MWKYTSELFVRLKEHLNRYTIFTTEFDIEVDASQLDDAIGDGDKLKWAQTVKDYKKESAPWKADARAAMHQVLEAAAITESSTPDDVVISLLLDHSGSMRGTVATYACALTEITADFWSQMGVSFEILGFTTSSWRGGESRKAWLAQYREPFPGRLCDLLHVVYRTADSTQKGAPPSIYNMLRGDLLKENVDGEAILWAAERLRARPEGRKILVVVSDGAPVDDSTLAANHPRILEDHVRKVISELETGDEIEISAIGLGHEVGRYYKRSLKIASHKDLSETLPKFICSLIS
ncbi:MAG TPA: hypothetical protein DIT67_02370 [Octadecabacter sp.]|nr:hypothetical protein [Octadecabacter sp.]